MKRKNFGIVNGDIRQTNHLIGKYYNQNGGCGVTCFAVPPDSTMMGSGQGVLLDSNSSAMPYYVAAPNDNSSTSTPDAFQTFEQDLGMQPACVKTTDTFNIECAANKQYNDAIAAGCCSTNAGANWAKAISSIATGLGSAGAAISKALSNGNTTTGAKINTGKVANGNVAAAPTAPTQKAGSPLLIPALIGGGAVLLLTILLVATRNSGSSNTKLATA